MVGFETCRKIRTTPIYTRMEHGAIFGQFLGYERPLYFTRENLDHDHWSSSGMSLGKRDFMGGRDDCMLTPFSCCLFVSILLVESFQLLIYDLYFIMLD